MIISHSSIMGPEFSIKLSSSLIITCWRFKSRFQLVGMFDDNTKTSTSIFSKIKHIGYLVRNGLLENIISKS